MDEKIKIDAKDRKILFELEQGCRRPLGQIAKVVGVSKQVLHYRIERLEKEGAIKWFLTGINVAKLEYSDYEVWVQLEPMDGKKKETLLHDLEAHENVWAVADCGGKFDLMVGIFAENIVQFNRIWEGIVESHPGCIKNRFFSISRELFAYPRAYLGGGEGGKGAFAISGEPKAVALDESERKILWLLANNARMQLVEMADKAGVSVNTARAKMKRMENEGIITGYKIQIDHAKIGMENYEILATLQNMNAKREKEIERYCEHNQYSSFLLKCIGKWDIDVGFDAKDSAHFQQILAEFRSKFAEVINEFEIVSIVRWRKFTYYPFGN